MTRQCNDPEKSTEFSNWLRKQDCIGSGRGFVAFNVDFLWKNYKDGKWLLIEEKRYGREPSLSQEQAFATLHEPIRGDGYKGFYYLIFENTTPEDGKIALWYMGKEGELFRKRKVFNITKDQLLMFLQFKTGWHIPPQTEADRKEEIIQGRYS